MASPNSFSELFSALISASVLSFYLRPVLRSEESSPPLAPLAVGVQSLIFILSLVEAAQRVAYSCAAAPLRAALRNTISSQGIPAFFFIVGILWDTRG